MLIKTNSTNSIKETIRHRPDNLTLASWVREGIYNLVTAFHNKWKDLNEEEEDRPNLIGYISPDPFFNSLGHKVTSISDNAGGLSFNEVRDRIAHFFCADTDQNFGVGIKILGLYFGGMLLKTWKNGRCTTVYIGFNENGNVVCEPFELSNLSECPELEEYWLNSLKPSQPYHFSQYHKSLKEFKEGTTVVLTNSLVKYKKGKFYLTDENTYPWNGRTIRSSISKRIVDFNGIQKGFKFRENDSIIIEDPDDKRKAYKCPDFKTNANYEDIISRKSEEEFSSFKIDIPSFNLPLRTKIVYPDSKIVNKNLGSITMSGQFVFIDSDKAITLDALGRSIFIELSNEHYSLYYNIKGDYYLSTDLLSKIIKSTDAMKYVQKRCFIKLKIEDFNLTDNAGIKPDLYRTFIKYHPGNDLSLKELDLLDTIEVTSLGIHIRKVIIQNKEFVEFLSKFVENRDFSDKLNAHVIYLHKDMKEKKKQFIEERKRKRAKLSEEESSKGTIEPVGTDRTTSPEKVIVTSEVEDLDPQEPFDSETQERQDIIGNGGAKIVMDLGSNVSNKNLSFYDVLFLEDEEFKQQYPDSTGCYFDGTLINVNQDNHWITQAKNHILKTQREFNFNSTQLLDIIKIAIAARGLEVIVEEKELYFLDKAYSRSEVSNKWTTFIEDRKYSFERILLYKELVDKIISINS